VEAMALVRAVVVVVAQEIIERVLEGPAARGVPAPEGEPP
jgi:hypothetical protein